MYLPTNDTTTFYYNPIQVKTELLPNRTQAANDTLSSSTLLSDKINEIDVFKKIEDYFNCASSKAKSDLTQEALAILEADDESPYPNFYQLLGLRMAFDKRKGKYRTETRGSYSPFNDIVNELLSENSDSPQTKNGVRKVLSDDFAESICLLNELIFNAANAQNRLAEVLPPEVRYFAEATWLAVLDNINSNKKTKNGMNSYIGFWAYLLGNFKLSSISNRLMLLIVNRMQKLNLSDSGLTNYTSNFNKILHQAKLHGWITGVDPLKSKPSNEREFYEIPIEKWELFCKLYSNNEQEYVFYMCLWSSIQRYSNLKYLKDSDINFDRNCLNIASDKHKSNNMIDIAISDTTAGFLIQAMKYKENNNIQSDYVFAVGADQTLPQVREKTWIECLLAAGLSKHITPHSLRIFGITDYCRLGLSDEEIMLISGHTTVEGLKRYKRIARDMQKGVLAANKR